MKQDNFERALVLRTSHGLERILIARVFFMLIEFGNQIQDKNYAVKLFSEIINSRGFFMDITRDRVLGHLLAFEKNSTVLQRQRRYRF